MPVYRFKPGTFAVNPTADSGSDAAMTGTGSALSDATKLAAFAGLSDSIPGSYPAGFPAQNDIVAYQNAIAYYDATAAAGGRSDRIRATAFTEVGTGIAIATKLVGHTINSAWMRLGLMDGDLYAGFPSGGGGLLHTHGVRVELRNASGALASTYRQFASVFIDGGNPALLNLNSSPWTPSLASITSAFGVNFYVYSDADSFELTPNMGVFALELSVDATAPGGSLPPSTAHIRHHRKAVAGAFLGGLE
jgi:hypothetical protein